MKLAANLSLLYGELPLEDAVPAARADGFIGVEILFPYRIVPEALSDLLRSEGLQLALINTPLGPHGEKGLASLPGREHEFLAGIRDALAVCAATGCRSIHVMAGVPPGPDVSRKDDQRNRAAHSRATLMNNVRAASALAGTAGVTLTLEALNRHDVPGYFYHLPQQARDIITTVDRDNVRLQFDFYHCQREGLDLPATLAEVLPLVHHVQFAHPAGRHEPDLADAGVRAALDLLAAGGYDGWVGCEYVPAGNRRAGLAWRAAYDGVLRGHCP